MKVANDKERKELRPLVMMKGAGELSSPFNSPQDKKETAMKMKALKLYLQKVKP